MATFWAKKIVSRFLFPVPLCLEILVIGLILLCFTRRQKAGKLLVSLGTALLLLVSSNITGAVLLKPLESRFPAILDAPAEKSVRYVVVLAGGWSFDPRVTVTSQLGCGSTMRVAEGVRLQRQLPGSKLVLSGGRLFGPDAAAEGMSRFAHELGVPSQNIMLEPESKDTEEEARLLAPILGRDPFILVTSAAHMPRSVGLFKKAGTNPIPAPTDHRVIGFSTDWLANLFPSAAGLDKCETAIYEYLALAWAKLRGKM